VDHRNYQMQCTVTVVIYFYLCKPVNETAVMHSFVMDFMPHICSKKFFELQVINWFSRRYSQRFTFPGDYFGKVKRS